MIIFIFILEIFSNSPNYIHLEKFVTSCQKFSRLAQLDLGDYWYTYFMTEKDYIVYKQRWLILAGVLVCAFIRGSFPGMFAISNDMMTVYFQISPVLADMLSSVDTAVAVIVCFGTSVVGKKVGVRLLSLTTAIPFAISCVTIGIAITSR